MADNESLGQIVPWELVSSTVALDEPWFPIRKDAVKLPSGKTIEDYFVWESPDIAFAAPYTSQGTFILCEQYRHAVGRTLLQFPAGAIEKAKNGAPGEMPEQAAARELEEETGYISSQFELLSVVAPYPTKVTCLNYLFLALDARLEGHVHEDEMEQTVIVEKTPAELRATIHDGSIQVAGSVALALLALNKLGL